jgi:ParB-like chromosome segregation protein Spo0J
MGRGAENIREGARASATSGGDERGLSDPAAVYVELSKLKPWDANPRRNKEAIHRVADSIRRWGFGAPIVARKENGEIIAGHTRYLAAKLLGLKTIPVRYLDINEKQAHLLALADNKLGEIAEWDDARLGEILSDASFGDALFAGWDGDELGKMAANIIGEHEAAEDADVENPNALWGVVIECDSEAQQVELLESLKTQGLNVRALI